ncbi:hypothetical protein SDC9_103845 [bioreactor metagenome]|uniref:Ig-like domain-containing protein n=1 Tax=bioreactor metagenome TaxID=1076179 RepID=A0A645AV78_9ZZZZ
MEDQTNIHAGNYSVTVSDVYGCNMVLHDTVLNVTSGVTIVQDSLFNENCGQGDGAVYVSIQGGTTPYDISWSSGAVSDDISGLNAGTYTLTVTDATSCSTVLNAVITNNTGGMAISFSNTQNEFCNHSDGFVDIEIAGGAAPYSYDWSNGDTTQDIVSVAAGTYTVSVTDFNGCTMTHSFNVGNSGSSAIVFSAVVDNTVCTSFSGSIDLTISGGLQPMTYQWSNGSSNQDLSALDDGTYIVVITDAVGCKDTNTYVIVQENNDDLAFDFLMHENDNCMQEQGYLYWGGQGATTYTYLLDDVVNASGYAPSLGTAWYVVSVIDESGCRIDSSIFIDNLASFAITGIVSDALCGNPDGAIDLNISGTGPYTYWWSNNATTEDLSGLLSGTYSVTVSDSYCADNMSFSIENEYDFTANTTVSNENCGDGTGSINLSVNPYVTSIYHYLWSNGATTQDISGLNAGIYSCTVTNVSSGCEQIISDTVFSLSSGLEIAALITSDFCSQGTGSCVISLTGGSGSYDYFWGHGPVSLSLSGMTAGSYSFTAIDQVDDCSTTEFIEIPDVRSFHASAIVTDASCGTCNDGMIDVIVTDASGYSNSFTYQWSHGPTSQDGVSLIPGFYTITITSSTGCDTTMTF